MRHKINDKVYSRMVELDNKIQEVNNLLEQFKIQKSLLLEGYLGGIETPEDLVKVSIEEDVLIFITQEKQQLKVAE